jgi:predicted aldo/keto reductase-like oxidoreductase
MKQITLGKTGITAPQNGFGALPIQRVDMDTAVRILRKAYEGGMTYFDTARAYSDSEEKLGEAFGDGIREKIFIATKTAAKTPEDFWKDLDTSLKNLRTDYIDLYQFHMVGQCYRPGDGTGMYECMLKAKEEGKIRHIGVTAHKLMVARELIESDLYETLQFPLSYLSSEKEIELVRMCKEHNMGYIAMKGLAGGLINRSDAAMAFMDQFDNVMPIWGIQKEKELDEWLSYMDETPQMTGEIKEFIDKEKSELAGDFCRGCGYCMPCPMGIKINNCARMSLMIRRAPSKSWLSEEWQQEMAKIDSCINCRECTKKCPYELSTPELLKKNYEDYKKVLAGEISV